MKQALVIITLVFGLSAIQVSRSFAENDQRENHATESHDQGHSHGEAYTGQRPQKLALPDHLLAVLRVEMNLIQAGMGTLLAHLSQGEGDAAGDVAETIQKSFVLKQQLGEEDLQLLVSLLPEVFVTQDRGFHKSAGELAAAARKGDFLSAVRIYGSMSESCVTCHTAYAGDRFPSLVKR